MVATAKWTVIYITTDAWDSSICYCECSQPPVILTAEDLVKTDDEKAEEIQKVSSRHHLHEHIFVCASKWFVYVGGWVPFTIFITIFTTWFMSTCFLVLNAMKKWYFAVRMFYEHFAKILNKYNSVPWPNFILFSGLPATAGAVRGPRQHVQYSSKKNQCWGQPPERAEYRLRRRRHHGCRLWRHHPSWPACSHLPREGPRRATT